MHRYSNKLVEESSPYLQQHAHNPVNWYPWSEEALERARREDKPILVSIGYAACHWCHVMEKESFENEATAALMNEHFINIKIDREERPDLDHIYMDAVQAISGSGGWPLNVFLTPERKPFYGGTYFPPVRAFNRASWTETLQGVMQAFKERRPEIDTQAENLTQHLYQSNSFGLQKPGAADNFFSWEEIEKTAENLLKTADTEWGGFGKAPKFPQTFSIQFLLRYAHFRRQREPEAGEPKQERDVFLQQALLSLDRMIEGGIYDQLGAGFARYSTDTEWLAPHFEKMLYDNALFISVLSEAYQLTGKQRYKEVIHETMEFLRREMLYEGAGFYAALDADSEGEEGKFYVWQKPEIEKCLGAAAAIFCAYYDVSEKGNWSEAGAEEGKNILRVKKPLEEFAAVHNIDPRELRGLLDRSKQRLMKERDKRQRPLLDDKIILGWNALMNTACSKAFAATGTESYRQLAIGNMQFLLDKFAAGGDKGLYHTWKNNKASHPGFLDDYAFLVQALLQLQEITADTRWLDAAAELAGYTLKQFSEPETGFFFYTREGQADVIVRKKEVYDGAVPSGNAVMADNLYRLGILLDKKEWRKRSQDIVAGLAPAIGKYPGSFGCWNNLLMEMTAGTVEIAVLGKNFERLQEELLKEFIPNKLLMATSIENQTFPLLAGKQAPDYPLVYVCKNFSCQAPVASTKAVMLLIDSAGRT